MERHAIALVVHREGNISRTPDVYRVGSFLGLKRLVEQREKHVSPSEYVVVFLTASTRRALDGDGGLRLEREGIPFLVVDASLIEEYNYKRV